jgi:hypothetical protein
MNRRNFLQTAGVAAGVAPLLGAAANSAEIDLKVCTVVIAENASRRERKAAMVLMEEVQKRSQLRWPIQSQAATASGTTIYLATRTSVPKLPSKFVKQAVTTPDGFSITSGTDANGRWIAVVAADERGLLFGVGKLLRTAVFGRQSATINTRLVSGTAAPKYPLRGHQLGYRPKTNAYDAWNVATWDQYIRDLAMFGTNAIELIPPRSDDESDSPHFPLPPEQMMVEMSRICDEYGLDVWIWYPAMDPDYADAATVESALNEWAQIFQKLPRVDAVFVPGGDPGCTKGDAGFFGEAEGELTPLSSQGADVDVSPGVHTGLDG